jgi:hypothetical protein
MCNFSGYSAAQGNLFSRGAKKKDETKNFPKKIVLKNERRFQNRMPARESACASGGYLKESNDDFHEATAFPAARGDNLAAGNAEVNKRIPFRFDERLLKRRPP